MRWRSSARKRVRSTSVPTTAALIFVVACACSSSRRQNVAAQGLDHAMLQPVTLPDLSKASESVRMQLTAAYASLTAKTSAAISDAEVGQAYGQMGTLLMAAEFRDVAEPALVNAAALDPTEVRWPYYLAHLHRLNGDPARAARSFERPLELKPDDLPALVWLGEVYLDQGRLEMAEPAFARALSFQPRLASALSGMGRIALAQKNYARAAGYLEDALAADPRASGLHYPLSTAYRALGQVEKADFELRQPREVESGPPDPLMDEMGRLLESAMAYQARGIRALEVGQPALAAEAFQRAIDLGPDTAALRHRLGTALFLADDVDGAVEQFEAALRLSPEFAKAHFSLGVILASQSRSEAAILRFSAAVKLEPDYREARLALADALRSARRPEEALPQYEEVLKANPREADARLGRAKTLVLLGNYQQARRELTEGARRHPDRGEFTDALAHLR